MAVSDEALTALERTLDGAALWGLELDTRYRVLAGTFEVGEEQYPDHGEVSDRRLQVLLFPVADIAACLLAETPEGEVRVERFSVEDLVDVVESFGGAAVSPPLFDPGGPGPDTWGPELSLEGRSSAPDGREHVFDVSLTGDGDRRLDFRATFDEVRLHDATGEEIPLTRLP